MNSEMVILMPVYNPNERIVNYVKKLKENNYQVLQWHELKKDFIS